MKRIIVIFALVAALFSLSGCYQNNQNGCPNGYYWNQNLNDCLPYPSGTGTNNPADPANYWLNFVWGVSKGYTYKSAPYPYRNPFNGSNVYPLDINGNTVNGSQAYNCIDICTQGGTVTVFIPGSWSSVYDIANWNGTTLEHTYHVAQVPPTMTSQYYWQNGVQVGMQPGYVVGNTPVNTGKKGTPCNPFYQ